MRINVFQSSFYFLHMVQQTPYVLEREIWLFVNDKQSDLLMECFHDNLSYILPFWGSLSFPTASAALCLCYCHCFILICLACSSCQALPVAIAIIETCSFIIIIINKRILTCQPQFYSLYPCPPHAIPLPSMSVILVSIYPLSSITL